MVAFSCLDPFCKTPFGAVPVGTPVELKIKTPPDLYIHRAELIVNDGVSDRVFSLSFERSEKEYNVFHLSCLPERLGIFFYYFRLYTEDGIKFIRSFEKEEGYLTDSAENGDSFQLTVYSAHFHAPDGWEGGIIYQIFPDRFCCSGQEKKNVPSDRILRTDWGATPYFLPDESGRITNNDYFCGDLPGILEKLDYFKNLGVTALYLNPIFEAHSNHRYNTANYLKIDPLLGTEEDFSALCKAAHSRGIRVIIDGVFSHTGSDSLYFNARSRYPDPGAANTMKSPYYSWYDFQEWPTRYTSWWGIDTLPAVNELDPSYASFICGEGGVIDTWLSRGADGFRLDVADELPDEFIRMVRAAVKRHGEDKLLIGEVWEDASNKISYGVRRRYFLGDELDSVMNYPFKDSILRFIRYGNSDLFREEITMICEHYPAPALNTAMNSISTHDTARAITMLAGPDGTGKDRLWQAVHSLSPEEYRLGANRLRLAMVLQYTLPGIPCIYYGDEAGLQGYSDPFNRACYPWGHEDRSLVDFAVFLGNLRHSCPALTKGSVSFLDTPQNLTAFCRKGDGQECLVLINTLPESVRFPLECPDGYVSLHGSLEENDVLLPAYGFAVFVRDIPDRQF